jgi:drug/metabolite transporter (DMT)-like permease
MFFKEKTTSSYNPLAIFGLLYGAICWGVVWFPYRLLNEAGINGIASSFYTYGIALLLASVYILKKWRHLFKLPLSIFWLCLVAGWTNIAYVLAVIDGEVIRVMLLFYLSPIWTLILSHFWLKERTNRRGLGIIMIALIGAFIMLTEIHQQRSNFLSYLPLPQNHAEWIALSAGIGFSFTNVITRKSSHLSIATKSFAVWIGVFFTSVIMTVLLKQPLPMPQVFSMFDWLLLIIIALMLISATIFVQYGVTKITATRASVIFLFELVVAAVAAYYLAGEVMQWNEWLGGALIILASLLSANQSQSD